MLKMKFQALIACCGILLVIPVNGEFGMIDHESSIKIIPPPARPIVPTMVEDNISSPKSAPAHLQLTPSTTSEPLPNNEKSTYVTGSSITPALPVDAMLEVPAPVPVPSLSFSVPKQPSPPVYPGFYPNWNANGWLPHSSYKYSHRNGHGGFVYN